MAAEDKGTSVGIYVCADHLTAVSIDTGRGETGLKAQATVPLPNREGIAAPPTDRGQLTHALKMAREKLGVGFRNVSMVVPHEFYQTRSVRLPEVPVDERRSLVRGEMEQAGALPFGAGAFEFLWLPAPSTEGRKQADVSVYYTTDALVEDLQAASTSAGLKLQNIQPESLAIMRSYLHESGSRKPEALLLVFETQSELCIHDGEAIRHMRRLPAGWKDTAKSSAGAQAMDVSVADVDERNPVPIVRILDFESDLGEMDDEAGNSAAPRPVGLPSDPRSALEFLGSEVSRSLSFYGRMFPTAPRPTRLVVIAPEFESSTVIHQLRDIVPLPVEAPPAPKRAVGTGGNAYEDGSIMDAVVAHGAALSASPSILPLVDISHQERSALDRQRAPVLFRAGVTGSTAWMVASIVAAIVLMFLESSELDRSTKITEETSKIRTEQAPKLHYHELLTAARKLEAKSAIPASDVLGRLAQAYAPGIALTSVKLASDQVLNIEGRASDAGTMELFAFNLSQGSALGRPVFDYMSKDRNLAVSFRLKCRTVPPEPQAE